MTAIEAEATIPGTGTPKLNKALSQLQGELPPIKKTKTAKIKYQDKAGVWNSHEYSYADLGDVVADVGPLLAKHGLAFHCAPTINPADRREMLLLWSLLHESGEEKSGEWPLGPVNQKPQSLGSAITYGRRYCFTAATNIVLDDDDDGQRAQQDHGSGQSAGDAWESASRERPQPQQQRPAPAVQRPAEAVPPSDDRPWLDRAIEQAAALKSERAASKLFQDALAKVNAREITRDDYDTLKGLIGAGVEDLRRKAMDRELNLLSENDEWRAKVEELDGDEAAQAALEELGRMVAARKMPETRAGRIKRAIVARWPHSTDTDSEATA